MRRVVVGIEELPHSEAALDWAVAAAEQRGAVLRLVHAVGFPMAAVDLLDDVLTRDAELLLDRAAARVHELAPTVEVDLHVDGRRPADALVSESAQADLLVVGTHRLTAVERAFAGSLAYQVVAHATGPVVVVPAPPAPGASGVVVGVDGSADSLAAVEIAAGQAEWTGQDLTVVHGWAEPAVYASLDVFPDGFIDAYREVQALVLGESVAGLADRHPDLAVHSRLVHEPAARALLGAAEHARLLVVGSRGRHGLVRMLLGSTSHTVVLHAPCPVLVVRTRHVAVPHH